MLTLLGVNLYFWLYFLLFSIAILLIIHFYIIYTHLNEIPVPPYIPILGHVLDFANQDVLKIMTKQLIKYGGVIRQYLGPRKPSITVASREFLKFLCQNKKYVGKAKFYRYLKNWLGEGLITSDGTKWLSRRRALTNSFTSTSVLKSFIKVFEEKTDVLMVVLEQLDNQKVDIHPIMKKYTLDVIYETAMGLPLNSQNQSTDSTYVKNIDLVCETIQRRLTSLTKQFDCFYKFSRDYQKEQSGLKVIDQVLADIIQNKKKKKNSEEETDKKCLLDSMMDLKIDGKSMDEADLREEVNTFLFAGYDTTSAALGLALYELAQHPEVQDNVLKEQGILIKKHQNEKVTYDLLMDMTYLEMVIKETLRMHTVVPFVGKRMLKDLKFGHITIPENLNINVLLYSLHRNPNYFPEPEKFIPERFADMKSIDEYTYMPFGVKPRQCIGKNFAMLEMKSAISRVIRNFELIAVPDHKLRIKPKLVLHSSTGMWITVKKRQEK